MLTLVNVIIYLMWLLFIFTLLKSLLVHPKVFGFRYFCVAAVFVLKWTIFSLLLLQGDRTELITAPKGRRGCMTYLDWSSQQSTFLQPQFDSTIETLVNCLRHIMDIQVALVILGGYVLKKFGIREYQNHTFVHK